MIKIRFLGFVFILFYLKIFKDKTTWNSTQVEAQF
jgi:hypothetical protein